MRHKGFKTRHMVLVLLVAAASYFFYEARIAGPPSQPEGEAAADEQAAENTESEGNNEPQVSESAAESPAEPAFSQMPPIAAPPGMTAAATAGARFSDFDAETLLTRGRQAIDQENVGWGGFLLVSFLRCAPDHDRAGAVRGQLAELVTERVDQAGNLAAEGKWDEARRAYSDAMFVCLDPERKEKLRKKLEELNHKALRAPQPNSLIEAYTVKSGDFLGRIGRQFGVPVEWIKALNGLGSSMIQVGHTLRVPRGPVEVWVSKREFRLYLVLGGQYLASFPVGTGRNDCTPEAEFVIGTKLKDPTWYKELAGGRRIAYPPGHVENILGTRWLGFKHADQKTSFGIHGTTMPETVGTESSDGCLRLKNSDVEQIYTMVPRTARVVVVR